MHAHTHTHIHAHTIFGSPGTQSSTDGTYVYIYNHMYIDTHPHMNICEQIYIYMYRARERMRAKERARGTEINTHDLARSGTIIHTYTPCWRAPARSSPMMQHHAVGQWCGITQFANDDVYNLCVYLRILTYTHLSYHINIQIDTNIPYLGPPAHSRPVMICIYIYSCIHMLLQIYTYTYKHTNRYIHIIFASQCAVYQRHW